MTQYLLRLDDASPYRNLKNWNRIEDLLERYHLAPIVGIIPNNRDAKFFQYPYDYNFWSRARQWQKKGWAIALHGYDHVYCSNTGGINPVNRRSEFAGLPLQEQEEKIEKGVAILRGQGITPRIFFAPSHTFDENTLQALRNKSNIRIMSDTVANDIYFEHDFYYIPQQAGTVRRLPFKTVTFCYHPDSMNEEAFSKLDRFLTKYQAQFVGFAEVKLAKRDKTPYDSILSFLYLRFRGLLR